MSDCSTCFYNNADVFDNTPGTFCSNPDVPKTRGIPDCPHYKKRYSYRLHDLEVENAELRQQLADVTESMGRVEARCAKLRELVIALQHCRDGRCDGECSMFTPADNNRGVPPVCEAYGVMRELGVED